MQNITALSPSASVFLFYWQQNRVKVFIFITCKATYSSLGSLDLFLHLRPMMGLSLNQCFPSILLCFLLLGLSSSSFISDDVFGSHAAAGRSLLQAKKACSVNFEFLNYTIITSKCKGPEFPSNRCCGALKDFACPYADEINDLTTDCATTMFSYINLYGKYPPGLFANECREGKEGLACPASGPSMSDEANRSEIICKPSTLLMFTVGFLMSLFHLL